MMKLFLTVVPKLLGRQGSLWFALSVISSLLLALTDYAIAIFIEVLLKALDLAPGEAQIGGFFKGWDPQPVHLLILLSIVGIVRGLSQFGQYQGNDLVHEVVNSRLRLLSGYEVLKDPAGKFVSAADTNVKVGEIFPKAGLFMFYSVTVVTMAIQCVVYLLAMVYIAWEEAFIGILGAGVLGIAVLKINRGVRRAASGIPEEQIGLIKGIQRTAGNWMLVQAFRTADQEHESLVERNLNYYHRFVRAKTLGNIAAVIPIVAGVFLLIAIIYASTSVFATSSLQLIAFIYLFGRFAITAGRLAKGFGLVSSVSAHFRMAAQFVSAFTRADIDLAASPLKGWGAIKSVTSKESRLRPPGEMVNRAGNPPEVSVNNVTFAYDADAPAVLVDASLKVSGGEQVGLIGTSGSGKSTLLGLTFGILKADRGEVLVGGIPADSYFSQYPDRLGYVGPDPYLIEGTIKDNLDYGRHFEYTDQMYWEVLSGVHLSDYVRNLKDGLNFKLDENGEGLSAGQRQRLSLARSLLRQPKVLILDEVSSNLDNSLEDEIASVIEQLKGKATVIIVSHRRGMLQYADRVYELTPNGLSQLDENAIES